MHSIDDKEKEGRKAALMKLKELMAGETGKRLSGLKKKPDVTVTAVEAEPEGGHDDDGDEPGGFCSHCGKPM